MSLLLANILGWIYANKRTVLIVAGVFVLLCLVVGIYRCAKPAPKLNQAEIIKSQQAIEKQDRQQMIEILAASDAREKEADLIANQAEANTAAIVRESKWEWAEKSNDELAKELERRAKQ